MSKDIISGSYVEKDVRFLLKNINGLISEQNNEFRENAIQSGIHYSQMLPIEYQPSKEYMDIFYDTLELSKGKLARLTAILAEKIVKKRGENIVVVSLARAGTPIGILIKRYIEQYYKIEVPHYSISIIRDIGIDENALKFILKKHTNSELQFIDGWTGKGVIQKTLETACEKYYKDFHVKLNPDLAVLSDPAYCTDTYATREDFLIPSACLNSTVSGLISRTVYNKELIGKKDFHGAKYYKEWEAMDVSRKFIDDVTMEFKPYLDQQEVENKVKDNRGLEEVKELQKFLDIDNINLIKPGVGETTRVLLRRMPWKILVDSLDNHNLKHIYKLCEEKNVPIEVFKDMSYSCCGVIKPKEREDI